MKFKSNAKYNKEPKTGSIFTLKDNSLRISIHKYVGCGDALFLNSTTLGIDNYDLETEDFNEAVSKSKEIVTERMKYLRDEAHKFIVDEYIEIVKY